MVLKRNQSGFTMVELLVALAVSSIVLTLMYLTYQSQLKTNTTQQELIEMQQNMRAALYLMEREIRMAGYGPEGGIADPAITTAAVDDIAFAMDIKDGATDASDGDTSSAGEQIRYTLDGSGNLVRMSNDGGGGWRSDILLDTVDINSLTFVYKDEDGQTPASASDILSVEIIITAGIGTTVMVDPHEMDLRSEVKVRNLGLIP